MKVRMLHTSVQPHRTVPMCSMNELWFIITSPDCCQQPVILWLNVFMDSLFTNSPTYQRVCQTGSGCRIHWVDASGRPTSWRTSTFWTQCVTGCHTFVTLRHVCKLTSECGSPLCHGEVNVSDHYIRDRLWYCGCCIPLCLLNWAAAPTKTKYIGPRIHV